MQKNIAHSIVMKQEEMNDFTQLGQINEWMSDELFNSDSQLNLGHLQIQKENNIKEKVQESFYILQSAAPKIFNKDFINILKDKIFTSFQAFNQKLSSNNDQQIQDKKNQTNVVTHISKDKQVVQYESDTRANEHQQVCLSQRIKQLSSNEEQNNNPLYLEEEAIVKRQEIDNHEFKDQQRIQKMGNIIIECFCQKGFNPEGFKEQLYVNGFTEGNHIVYQQFIRQITLKAFNKLQQFLKNDCMLQIPALKVQFGDEKVADTLTFYQSNFTAKSCKTLIEIIRDDNGFATTQQVDASSAVRLFEEIQEKLHYIYRSNIMLRQDRHAPLTLQTNQKIQKNHQKQYRYEIPQLPTKNFYNDKSLKKSRNHKTTYSVKETPARINDIDKMNSIWTVEFEMEVIIGYKSKKTINQITESMKMNHPQDHQNITSSGVRSNVFKIIRQAIHKLYDYVFNQGRDDFPNVKRINYTEVRYVIHNGASLPCRILLMDIYCSRKYDKKLVEKTINEIQYYLLGLKRQKQMSEFRQNKKVGLQEPLKKGRQRFKSTIQYSKINMFDSNKYIRH